jgi:hypothetical protein
MPQAKAVSQKLSEQLESAWQNLNAQRSFTNPLAIGESRNPVGKEFNLSLIHI